MESGESSAFDAGQVSAPGLPGVHTAVSVVLVAAVFVCFLCLVVVWGSEVGSGIAIVGIAVVIITVAVAVIAAAIVIVLNLLVPHVVELDENPGGIIVGFFVSAAFQYTEPRLQQPVLRPLQCVTGKTWYLRRRPSC